MIPDLDTTGHHGIANQCRLHLPPHEAVKWFVVATGVASRLLGCCARQAAPVILGRWSVGMLWDYLFRRKRGASDCQPFG